MNKFRALRVMEIIAEQWCKIEHGLTEPAEKEVKESFSILREIVSRSQQGERADSAALVKCRRCGQEVFPICKDCLYEYGLPVASALPCGANNTGSPKSAPEIIEADDPCDYCTQLLDDGRCMQNATCKNYSKFVGRRLRAGA